MSRWHPARLPPQHGRTFVVTGGNAGLGYFTVEQLASTGARVILASRSESRADAAMAAVRRLHPAADLGFVHLDLADLDSVREAGTYLGGVKRLDGLVLNAGMTSGSRHRRRTVDGNELTLQANHLGHFALTALALPALERGDDARVIGLGSIVTRLLPLRRDLQSEHGFWFFGAYATSKHAVHGFVFELDRRLRAAGSSVSALLAHPGFSLDGLSAPRAGITRPSAASSGPRLGRAEGAEMSARVEAALAWVAQGKNRGAAPTVRALLDPSLAGGDFIGPNGVLRGRPRRARAVAASASPAFGARLWADSERWTHTPFPLG